MRRVLVALLVLTGGFALSCGDSGPSGPDPSKDPVAGWLKVRLTTPNADDGGIMFAISGGQIDSVKSAYSEFYMSSVGASKRVIVAGTLPTGSIVAEILIPNIEQASNYSATVEQVAAKDTYQQRSASGVSLVLEGY
ncbi:MAG: hypothetical protein HKO65_12895 [Gemmatimonadetes bacterium]|nr:hypothetical protein [Gemmatimonadota bacterium]NNM05979.1 hypothetical protein [Gemmatimonadota bacterium]